MPPEELSDMLPTREVIMAILGWGDLRRLGRRAWATRKGPKELTAKIFWSVSRIVVERLSLSLGTAMPVMVQSRGHATYNARLVPAICNRISIGVSPTTFDLKAWIESGDVTSISPTLAP